MGITQTTRFELEDLKIEHSPDGFVRIYRKDSGSWTQVFGGDGRVFAKLATLVGEMEKHLTAKADDNK